MSNHAAHLDLPRSIDPESTTREVARGRIERRVIVMTAAAELYRRMAMASWSAALDETDHRQSRGARGPFR